MPTMRLSRTRASGLPQRSSMSLAGRRNCLAACSLPEWTSICGLGSAVLVFERSLAYLRALLPETPVIVVYIPSPLSSYRLISPDVSFQDRKTGFSTRKKSPRTAIGCVN